MTPQQLKALLPTSNTAESSNDNTTNNNEKLYNLTELGLHYGKHPTTIGRFIAKYNIKHQVCEAKFGIYKYYRLKDLKDYKPLPPVTKRKHSQGSSLIKNSDLYTIREISNYYNISTQLLNYYVKAKNIKFITKFIDEDKKLGRRNIRYFKLNDFNFLNSSNPNYKALTLFQRIKLLFGFDI
jgi:hypothetical protein